ncbi:MAG: FecR family protein [Firmicutes bacterium]|nr:FecR family protein [Bacillota bacterium]
MKFKQICATFLSLVMVVSFAQTTHAAAPIRVRTVQVFEIEGNNVSMLRRNSPVNVRAGTRLSDGNTLVTGTSTNVFLRLDQTSLVKLDSSSRMNVELSGGLIALTVESGNALLNVAEQQNNQTLEVRIGDVALTVRGTMFTVGHHRDYAFIAMLSGSGDIDVIEHLLAAGEIFIIRRNAQDEPIFSVEEIELRNLNAFTIQALIDNQEYLSENSEFVDQEIIEILPEIVIPNPTPVLPPTGGGTGGNAGNNANGGNGENGENGETSPTDPETTEPAIPQPTPTPRPTAHPTPDPESTPEPPMIVDPPTTVNPPQIVDPPTTEPPIIPPPITPPNPPPPPPPPITPRPPQDIFPGNGSGTADDPFKIGGFSDLDWINGTTDAFNNETWFFELEDTITLPSGWNFGDRPFNSVLDGGANTLHGLLLATTDSALFQEIGTNGIVRNLTVTTSIGSNNAAQTAGIAQINNGLISNVVVEGSITAHHQPGVVSGNKTIGGLVAINNGIIEYSGFIGDISSDTANAVGGVIGINHGEIRNSFADLVVPGWTNIALRGRVVGGIAGINDGTIERTHTSGEIVGIADDVYDLGVGLVAAVGGIVGISTGGAISDSYSTATLRDDNSGGIEIGGIAGALDSTTVNRVYTTSEIIINHPSSYSQRTGGIVGWLLYGSEINNAVAANARITNPNANLKGAIFGNRAGSSINNTFAWEQMEPNPPVNDFFAGATSTVTTADLYNNDFWRTRVYFDFNNVWSADILEDRLPTLQFVRGQYIDGVPIHPETDETFGISPSFLEFNEILDFPNVNIEEDFTLDDLITVTPEIDVDEDFNLDDLTTVTPEIDVDENFNLDDLITVTPEIDVDENFNLDDLTTVTPEIDVDENVGDIPTAVHPTLPTVELDETGELVETDETDETANNETMKEPEESDVENPNEENDEDNEDNKNNEHMKKPEEETDEELEEELDEELETTEETETLLEDETTENAEEIEPLEQSEVTSRAAKRLANLELKLLIKSVDKI